VALKRQPEKPIVKAPPRRAALKGPFTMRHLWRTSLWGATAAGALLLAALSSRSEVGSQRIATALSPSSASGMVRAAQPFDAQTETRRLAAAVRDLAAENGELKSRLAQIEQNMSDITGSVTRQIQAVKAETARPWPSGAKPVPLTAAEIASIMAPPAQLTAFGAPLPSRPSVAPALQRTEAAVAASAAAYGIDIGGALSIPVLRARWLGVRSVHQQLFEGLSPSVELRQIPPLKRPELRLVVGPLPDAAAAARLCAALLPYRLPCQPTPFDRARVALE
jgi:hypothetical protein